MQKNVEENKINKLIKITNEKILKGTDKTIIDNIDFFENDEAFIIHADNYYLGDLKELVEAHRIRPKKCLMTMMAFKTSSPSKCGILEVDKFGILKKFHEKKLEYHGNLANGAIYILSVEILKEINKEFSNYLDFSTEIIPEFIDRIYIHETKEIIVDIGEPETYKYANSIKYQNNI